jgi:hypothetical protein
MKKVYLMITSIIVLTIFGIYFPTWLAVPFSFLWGASHQIVNKAISDQETKTNTKDK